MGLIGEKLIEVFPPEQREVWLVKDDEIRMNPDGRENKIKRPVLIVSAAELLKDKDFPLNKCCSIKYARHGG